MKNKKMRLGHLTEGKAVFKLEWNGDFKPHTPIQHHTQSTKRLRLSFKTIQQDKCWAGEQHTLLMVHLSTQPFSSWKSLILPSLPDECCHDELPKRHSKAALRAPVSSDCLMFVRPELCWEEMLWVMDSPAISTWARLLSRSCAVYCTALWMSWLCQQIHKHKRGEGRRAQESKFMCCPIYNS